MVMYNPTPIFVQALIQLNELLSKVETYVAHDPTVLDRQLADDMLPLHKQVTIAANFALRACCPLAGLEVVSFEKNKKTFNGLKHEVSDTIAYLQTIPPEKFERHRDDKFTDKAGFTVLNLEREEFLNLYMLPNFYFHISMVYAIARSENIPLSKRDYDGYHEYPDDFSLVEQ